jgi:hypothetical protein
MEISFPTPNGALFLSTLILKIVLHCRSGQKTLTPVLEITYEVSDDTMQRTDGDLDINDKLVGIRFDEIDVPQDATILSANLEFNADGTVTAVNPNVDIFAIDDDDTQQFSIRPISSAVETHDNDPIQATKIPVTYESNITTTITPKIVRERLIELVNEIPASGVTPNVKSLPVLFA